MFCSNCGNKVAEGSKFCSACGARIIAPEAPAAPVEQAESSFKAAVVEPAERPAAVKKPSVSFDWSNVKEEPHKKPIPEVASPWGNTTGLTEADVEPEAKPANNNSRTMSFIEVIQREREEKALAAQELAREVTERQEVPKDYSIFDDAPKAEPKPDFYIPPMYEVPAAPATPVVPAATQSPIFEQPVFEEPRFEEPKFEEPKYSAPVFDPPAPKHEAYSEPVFEAQETASVEDAYVDPTYVEPSLEVEDYLNDEPAEPVYPAEEFAEEAPVEEEFAEEYVEESSPLDAQLAAILAAGAGKTSAKHDAPEVTPLADEYLAMDEFAAEEPEVERVVAPVKGEPEPEEITLEDFAAPAFEEEPEFEELGAPAVETKEPIVFEEPEIEEPEPVVIPEPVAAPAVEEAAPVADEKDAEIELLKRRLAELMGEAVPAEEPVILKTVAEEPAPVVEEVVPVVQEAAPVVEEVVPVVQEVAPVVEEVVPVIQEVAPAVEEPVAPTAGDVMSAEELERDLFGEVVEVPAEVEATKKIDKFYTLYKKNEEFQRLLDEEYNKLKSGEEVVPTVESVIGTAPAVETPVVAAKAPAAPVVAKSAPSIEEAIAVPTAAPVVKAPAVEPAPIDDFADDMIAKDEVIEDRQTGKGGTVLTIIAVLIAILLVILLAIILVLNFAPDSGIAMKLDSVIETIGSYFSVVDITDTFRI